MGRARIACLVALAVLPLALCALWLVSGKTAASSSARILAVGPDPIGVAVDPALGRAYVLSAGDNSVTIIDTASLATVRTVRLSARSLAAAPSYVETDPVSGNAFISTDDGELHVLNARTGAFVATIALSQFGAPTASRLDAEHGRLVVTDSAGAAFTIDTRSGALLKMAPFDQAQPVPLSPQPLWPDAYACATRSGRAARIAQPGQLIMGTARAGQHGPVYLVTTPQQLIVGGRFSSVIPPGVSARGKLLVVDPATCVVTRAYSLDGPPDGVLVFASGNRLGISVPGPAFLQERLLLIDSESGRRAGELLFENRPHVFYSGHVPAQIAADVVHGRLFVVAPVNGTAPRQPALSLPGWLRRLPFFAPSSPHGASGGVSVFDAGRL